MNVFSKMTKVNTSSEKALSVNGDRENFEDYPEVKAEAFQAEVETDVDSETPVEVTVRKEKTSSSFFKFLFGASNELEKEDELDQLFEPVATLNENYETFSRVITGVNKKIRYLEKANQRKKRSIDKLIKTLDSLSAEKNDLTDQIALYQLEVSEAEKKLDVVLQEKQLLEKSFSESSDERVALESTLSKTCEELQLSLEFSDQLEKKISQLNEHKNAATQENEKKEGGMKALKEKI